ncbi:helix-turn-helix transcriptional regulator [Shinella sp. BYT-45]|uniref:helix-turn-helix transcriptional regulator n=1 Tax=Shinella sp. BYT-45 TaxID=3377377 RepID=UPI00397F21D8
MTLHQSERSFTPSELLRSSAESALGVEPVDMSPAFMETPVFSGRMLFREVQPGLTVTADDVTYLVDQDLVVSVEPSLVCGLLLEGEPEAMMIGEQHRVAKSLHRPVLVGYGKRNSCRWTPAVSRRSSSAGFMIKPSFFDRFANDLADDGLAVLHDFLTSDFRIETLARSPSLVERARMTLNHPYNGQLGELFLESNTLFLVTEVADQLSRQGQLVATLGKRHYDRVMEARDILDGNLISPPTTLELARRVGVNITTLQANFRTVFDTTIFGYVREQRLTMGRILLAEHGLSVADAGRKVGFSSPSAFAAAYKRQFGHPPTSERSARFD